MLLPRYAFFMVFLIFSQVVSAQVRLDGRIVDDQNDRPIAGASIFLNNSSIGTSADRNGAFVLQGMTKGIHEVVVSSIGYETLVFVLEVGDQPLAKRLIKLTPKTNMLDEVVISPFPDRGWERWGKVFLDAFIGMTANARFCTLKNRKALNFFYDKQEKILKVTAKEPLLIENRALGYTISYLLEDFQIDYRTGVQFYAGYPHFKVIKKGKLYDKRRMQTYIGSPMHFMRSLFNNQVEKEGFEMRHLEKIRNLEKDRVKALQQCDTVKVDGRPVIQLFFSKIFPDDSVSYYRQVLRQKDTLELLHSERLSADSVVRQDTAGNKLLAFDQYLHVRDLHAKKEGQDVSILQLTNNKAIIIDQQGGYYPPQFLLMSLYWASSRMADTLPLDYQPEY